MDYFTDNHNSFARSTMSDEDNLEHYFANYKPLSNLPTPPLTAASTPPEADFGEVDPEVLGPAIRIANLVPRQASRSRLCPGKLAEYLTRAQLSFSTLCLAGCLLDALSSSFVRNWRNALLDAQASQQPPSSSSSRPPTRGHRSRRSTNSVVLNWQPELIALAALQVSASFLEDVRSSPKWWAEKVSVGDVSSSDLDATIRCILQDINYDLCSFTSDDVEQMRRVMMRGVHEIDSARERKSQESEESWMSIVLGARFCLSTCVSLRYTLGMRPNRWASLPIVDYLIVNGASGEDCSAT
ncbi:hypothetical protein BT63DRAFT_458131 [Microthyrium microscopicum]|uniref:Cyclin N-terminal domain-containing protein n=1 Tax=Microthyrium microscopicum TaxID=703497 RepID=A0A6A6U6U7_9PEZI|nr:hypothetical protein BT63DRAFT_458131 [Microthyrium microscopicum]